MPLRTSAVVRKRGQSAALENLLVAVQTQAERMGAKVERVEDGLRVQLPVLRIDELRDIDWVRALPFPFQKLRTVDVRVRETDRAFNVVVSARTSVVVPIIATGVAYAIASALSDLANPPAYLAPLLGVLVGLGVWGYQWLQFSFGVQSIADRCDAALAAGGA